MRVKKISAFIMAVMLVLSPFTLFSFAADSFSLKDSGSPQVSMMAMRSIAANEGISLAAAEGNSGQFGYNIEPYDVSKTYFDEVGSTVNVGYMVDLPAGSYSFSFSFNADMYQIAAYDEDSKTGILYQSANSSSSSASFSLNVPTRVSLYGRFNSISSPDEVDIVDFSLFRLIPVEGISCGWSVNQAFSETNRRDSFEDFTWYFGNQPAGNYILNIYHYGIAYTCDWHIAYGSSPIGENSRFIPVSNLNGVSTAIVSHGGGDLILSGEVIFAHPYGDGFFDGSGNYSEYNGSGSFSFDIFQRDNWSYAVSDVIIVPLESAGLEQFGIFGSIVGFLRDEFSSMKSWIATQIDKIAGDDETKATVDNAASELEKEVNDLNTLHGQLDSQASTLEQQFSNDFAVPSEVSGQTANLQLMYSGIFSSLGVFSIFIWLPVVLAVIKKLLRL